MKRLSGIVALFCLALLSPRCNGDPTAPDNFVSAEVKPVGLTQVRVKISSSPDPPDDSIAWVDSFAGPTTRYPSEVHKRTAIEGYVQNGILDVVFRVNGETVVCHAKWPALPEVEATPTPAPASTPNRTPGVTPTPTATPSGPAPNPTATQPPATPLPTITPALAPLRIVLQSQTIYVECGQVGAFQIVALQGSGKIVSCVATHKGNTLGMSAPWDLPVNLSTGNETGKCGSYTFTCQGETGDSVSLQGSVVANGTCASACNQ